MSASCIKTIEDWKAFNAACNKACQGKFIIIGAEHDENYRWFAIVTIVEKGKKPIYYHTDPLYATHDEAFKMALKESERWQGSPILEGGRVVPKEELWRK